MNIFNRIGRTMIVLTLCAGSPGFAAGTKELPAAAGDSIRSAVPVKPAPAKTILFFLNPNGRPCQIQKAILDNIKDSLSGLAEITYIKTTEKGDRNTFYRHGIRGLPALIITDKNGAEIYRFAPGIQDEKTILSALRESGGNGNVPR